MRAPALVLALVVVLLLSAAAFVPSVVTADSGTISRDARGAQTTGEQDPLGGPPTPRLYVLGQTAIFVAGVALLVVAALLGAYTLLLVRRAGPRRPTAR